MVLLFLISCREDKPPNQFPEIEEVLLSPDSPEVNQEITCLVDAVDPEGKELTQRFSWMINADNIGEGETIVVSPDIAAVGDTLTCDVSVTDVFGAAISSSVSATIVNSFPEVQELEITPSIGVYTNSFLTCSAKGFDINDGELADLGYEWFKGETPLGSGSTIQLDHTLVQPEESIRCAVTAVDQHGGNTTRGTSVHIENSAPVFEEAVAIIPNRGVFTNTEILCMATVSDMDGETPVLDYLWTVNGEVIASTPDYIVNEQETNISDEIICTVTARDGFGGEAVGEASVTVLNTRPEITAVQILSPSGFYYNDEIVSCLVTIDDIDEDPDITYSWFVNGDLVSIAPNLDLNNQTIFPHDTLSCSVLVTDSYGDTDQSSVDITIGNRAPTAPTAFIDWSTGGYFILETDDLICQAEGATDPDGETLSYSYDWNSDVGGSATGSVLPSTNTSAGETWTCLATASDGDLFSQVSTSLQISPPADPDCDFGYCNFNLDLGGGESLDMMLIDVGLAITGTYELTHEYYMMTTEITQGMFAQVMGYQSYDEANTSDLTGSFGIGANYPAYHMNWHMAADFANFVTDQHNLLQGTSLNHCYACTYTDDIPVYCTVSYHPYFCDGYRLPTEAEWEHAARSGSSMNYWSIDGGGNLDSNTCLGFARIIDGVMDPFLTEYAWSCGNNGHHSNPYGAKEVAQKYPNGYELFDMHGNVQEWTTDWEGCSYPNLFTEPYCDIESAERILKGGGWAATPLESALGYRSSQIPHERSQYTGGRLVRMIYP